MDQIQNTSATLAGKTLGCFNIFLVPADRLINLEDNIQNMSATLSDNKFELCLALVKMKCSRILTRFLEMKSRHVIMKN